MTQYISTSGENTFHIAQIFAQSLQATEVICLSGEIGAGKTYFTKGIGKAIGINPAEIISPTFVLRRDYQGKNTMLYHFDLYRLETISKEQLESIGLFDVINEGIVVIEWGEKAYDFIPYTKTVSIQSFEDTKREIYIKEEK